MSEIVKVAIAAAVLSAVAASFLSARVAAPVATTQGPPAAPMQNVNATTAKAPPSPVATASGYGWVRLAADRGGQYAADVEIDGRRIPMLVDTGATLVSLSWNTADKLGIRPAPADFKNVVHTANGTVKVALVTLQEVRLGTLSVRGVSAVVSQRDVSTPDLLGMSFLQKLKFEIADGSLMLRQ